MSAQHRRGNVNSATANKGWLALVALATAQFLALISLGFTRELLHERPAPRTNRDPAAVPA